MKIRALLLSTSIVMLLSISGVWAADDSKYTISASTNPAVPAGASTFPTFQEIMKDFGETKPTFQDCCNLYNPTIMLNDIYLEFQQMKEAKVSGSAMNESLKNLFLKFVFVSRFHFMLSGQILEPQIILSMGAIKPQTNFSPLTEFDMMKSNGKKSLKPKDSRALVSLLTNEKWDPKNNDLKPILKLFGLQSDKLFPIDVQISLIIRHIVNLVSPRTLVNKPFESVVSKNPGLLSSAAVLGIREALEYCFDTAIKAYAQADIQKAAKFFKLAAIGGDINAIFNLGVVCSNEGKLQEAESLYRKAAAWGHTDAIFSLGEILLGKGDAESLAEAEKLYRHPLLKGASDAMCNLSTVLIEKGDEKSLMEAEKVLRSLVSSNIPNIKVKAVCNLGVLLAKKGDKKSLAEAEPLLRHPSLKYIPQAMCNLGGLLIGKGDKESLAEAERLLRPLASTYTPLMSQAMCNLGVLLRMKGDAKSLAEAEKLFRHPTLTNNFDIMCNLASVLTVKGDEKSLLEAEKILSLLVSKGHSGAMCNLGVLLMRKGDAKSLAEAEEMLKPPALRKIPQAMYHLGVLLKRRSNFSDAKKWLVKASEAGIYRSLIDLASIVKLENPTGAEVYLKQAISYGVSDAELYYAEFLFMQRRIQEALYYQEFYEEETDESVDDFSSSDDELLQPPAVEREPVASPSQKIKPIPEVQASQSVTQMNEKSLEVEQYVAPAISKKQAKVWARMSQQLKQAEERAEKERVAASLRKSIAAKTYRDVQVTVLPEAQGEIVPYEFKIQGLISMLVNGETKRGKFEFLEGYDHLCSMRLTKGDRLVFEITEGNLEHGIRAIRILSAKGHYDHLSTRARKTVTAIPVQWRAN